VTFWKVINFQLNPRTAQKLDLINEFCFMWFGPKVCLTQTFLTQNFCGLKHFGPKLFLNFKIFWTQIILDLKYQPLRTTFLIWALLWEKGMMAWWKKEKKWKMVVIVTTNVVVGLGIDFNPTAHANFFGLRKLVQVVCKVRFVRNKPNWSSGWL